MMTDVKFNRLVIDNLRTSTLRANLPKKFLGACWSLCKSPLWFWINDEVTFNRLFSENKFE